MKKSFKIISAAILSTTMAMGLGATIFASSRNVKETEAYYSPSTHYEVSDTASKLASYYSTISDTATGSSLLSALQTLNSSKRKKTIGYSAMGTSASESCYVYTDYDPNYTTTDSNGQIYGTKVLSFYTKTSSTGWNREHVWPNSHGGGEKGSSTGTRVDQDIFMPRPTISSENSSRGNSYYVEGLNSDKNGWDPYTAGYEEWVRGECARIILYCVVANTSLTLNNNTSSSTPDATMGKMETLIKWHYTYSPNEYEINRNNGGQYLQGNRNPFVDHPEYVSRIWGVSSGPTGASSSIASQVNNASSTYDSWVAGSGSTYGTNDATGGSATQNLTISSSAKEITVGDSATIYATSSNGSNITWTTSNASVVSLSKTTSASGSAGAVTLTAVAAGSATITAKATISGTQYSKTCAVTVKEAGTTVASDASIVPSDLDSSYPTSAKDYTSANGLAFKAYNTANFSDKVQFKKSGGYIYNTSSLNLGSITINDLSGTLTVYGGTSANPSGTAITGTNGVYDLSGKNYFKIINSSSGVATASSIDVSLASSTTPTITLNKSTASIAVNGSTTLTATTANGSGNVTWSTNNSNVQLNTTTGNSVTVTGKTAGTSTITATYSGKTATCTVTVTSATTPTVNSVTVAPATLSLDLNGTKTSTLTATVSVSNGAAQTVNWSSSNTNIVTVSGGTVTAKAVGTATITATSTVDSSKKGTCTVTVTDSSVSSTTTYNLVTNGLSAGDKVVIVAQANRTSTSGYAMTNSIYSSYYMGKEDVTISNQQIEVTSTMGIWTLESYNGGLAFYCEDTSKYLGAAMSGTHRNLVLQTSKVSGTDWTITENSAGTGYDMKTTHSSNNLYLEYFSSKSDFSAYTSSATDYVLNFYRETTVTTNPAKEYAQNFLAAFTCDATGTNAPTFTTTWAQLKTAFQALATPHQNTLTNATANESGTDIEKAVARYDYVVAKYSYEDFMNRNPGNGSNRMSVFKGTSTNNILLILGSISLLGGLTYLAYFLKKRKED